MVYPEVEMLARMWMECDPNRGPCDPEELIEPHADSDGDIITTNLTGKPRWHWFIPRAEASLRYFGDSGFVLLKNETNKNGSITE